jgi:hypothetical protein
MGEALRSHEQIGRIDEVSGRLLKKHLSAYEEGSPAFKEMYLERARSFKQKYLNSKDPELKARALAYQDFLERIR